MSDTPKQILQKQFEIVMAKPFGERVSGLFEMTDLSRTIIKNRIEINNPELSDLELKVEAFKAFYKSDFDDQSLNQIIESMKRFWNTKK
ncbi:MAG: hypothetical protein KAT15_17610 [Bacteroidales bacterium]|nr:hypothetical protein [Bacteroidales bacterium]